MPRKRVSEKEIILSTPVPSRRKPATRRVKPAAPASEESPAAESRPAAPSREEIASLAHSYWEARGCQGGSPEEDWLRAERELASR